MTTTALRFTTRLSALAVSAGALVILLVASPARPVDVDATIEAQQRSYLQGLLVRHNVRYALELSRDTKVDCGSIQTERG